MNIYQALIVAGFAWVTGSAQAGVGVSLGHHTWAEDGFPTIGLGEQVSVFYCTGKMDGPDAMKCALEKCKKAFNVPANAKERKVGPTTLIGGKCSPDGYTNKRGHSIIMVGPKGDNSFIMSKALGDPTREKAMEYVSSNRFPVHKSTVILDYWDNDGLDVMKWRGVSSGNEGEHVQSMIYRAESGKVSD